MDRRSFIKATALTAGSIAFMPFETLAERTTELPFRISLAEWSLHRNLQSGKINNLDFAKIARREFGIDAVEYVDQFFADKSKDAAYLKDLKSRADGEGVYSHLIMVDTNGPLGAADKTARDAAVEKTKPWIDAAKFLGCRLVRVNAYGDGNADELRARVAESCATLADYAKERELSLAIENHGKLSSDPEWLTSLIHAVNKENFGTLPDFGNFPEETNRYDAVEALMPLAKAVSAKSRRFNAYGLITDTDYFRMMRIVRDGGYTGYVGIESAPEKEEEEYQAVRNTLHVLQLIRDEQSKCIPIFNGLNLSGWTPLFGGEWTVENGVLIGKNGEDWSTDPSKSGSWLSTNRQYSDFRLELQFTINKGGNSGVFIRSSHRENPAFTGYEVQIYDAPGAAPSSTGPGSLYDLVAPEKNLIRKAGEWNSLTVIAQNERIRVEMNGEKVLETHKRRSLKGYIGLQNHDEKSEVRFKNIRLEVL
jgi:sugar phosphate isomerase/epimerase